ncbi:hypothetical protein KBC31_02905 [Candidatus Saccharibacteria bacterium]|jgi:sugar/nucleoside kinase (ribokinase family)|nr:hypothetical protein [Candidatus Saccharibacteria bacterium]
MLVEALRPEVTSQEAPPQIEELVDMAEIFATMPIDMIGVGGAVKDSTMPHASENPFTDIKDKLTVHSGTTLEKAVEIIMGNDDNKQAFCRIVGLSQDHELSEDEVVYLINEAGSEAPETTGGAVLNMAGTFSKFKRKNDRITVVASGGDDKYLSFFRHALKDMDVKNDIRGSKVNPKSTVFPWIADEEVGRDILTKRPKPPKFDPKALFGKNCGFASKLSEPTWAKEMGKNTDIKVMMWVPGNTIGEMAGEVIGSMKRDGSRFVVCNLDEANTVFDDENHVDKESAVERLAEMFPGVRFVVTDGSDGASYAIKKKDGKLDKNSYKNNRKIKPPKNGTATGAGDVYSMTLLAATLYGLSIEESMEVADFAAREVMCSPDAVVPEWKPDILTLLGQLNK